MSKSHAGISAPISRDNPSELAKPPAQNTTPAPHQHQLRQRATILKSGGSTNLLHQVGHHHQQITLANASASNPTAGV